jgi:hypothetical protein
MVLIGQEDKAVCIIYLKSRKFKKRIFGSCKSFNFLDSARSHLPMSITNPSPEFALKRSIYAQILVGNNSEIIKAENVKLNIKSFTNSEEMNYEGKLKI